MKKIIFLFLALVLLFSACKMSLSENMGVVVIGIDGSLARQIGENGLPVLSKAQMTISVAKTGGGQIESKDFSADDEKTMTLTLPIDEEITITVAVKNLSGVWYGEKEHKVISGENKVSVMIGQKAVELNNILFTLKAGSNQLFTSTLKIGETKIGVGGSGEAITSKNKPAICRDNKGRIYLAYTDNADNFIFKRYDSERNEDKVFTLSSPHPALGAVLASDWVTGKTYIYAGGKLYREDGDTFKEISSPLTGELFAVSGDKLVFVHDKKLNVYNITKSGDSFSVSKLLDKEIWKDIDFKFDVIQGADIKDVLIRADYIYLLFGIEAIEHPVNNRYYTVGGLVRYKMEKTESGWQLGDAEKFGFSDDPSFENNMVKPAYYKDNFYGPVSFIGFDKENLYIADDGLFFEKTDAGIIVKENHDRIVKFEFADKDLSFEKAPSDVKWILDKEVKGTGSVTITIGDDGWQD